MIQGFTRKPDHDDQPACNRMMERLGGSEGKEGPTNVAKACIIGFGEDSPLGFGFAKSNLRPARQQAIRFQVCSGSHGILTQKAARGVRTLQTLHGMVLRGAPLGKFSRSTAVLVRRLLACSKYQRKTSPPHDLHIVRSLHCRFSFIH